MENNKQVAAKFIKKCAYRPKSAPQIKIQAKDFSKNCFNYEQKINYSRQVSKQDLNKFEVIGMAKNQIFCIYSPQLQLFGAVDQHAIHQRIRYEFYSNALVNISAQKFKLNSIQKNKKTVTLAKGNIKNKKLMLIRKLQQYELAKLKQRKISSIQRFGFALTVQNYSIFLQQYCEIVGHKLDDPTLHRICSQIIDLLMENSDKIPATLDNIIAQHSCKSAIKFGDEVTRQWCKDTLFNASLCTFPWSCVHGRPTVHFSQLTFNQANREYSLQ